MTRITSLIAFACAALVLAGSARPALTVGVSERRDPNPLFDTGFYLATNPDVDMAGVDPLLHYLLRGAAEGRDPSATFDSLHYIRSFRNEELYAWRTDRGELINLASDPARRPALERLRRGLP